MHPHAFVSSRGFSRSVSTLPRRWPLVCRVVGGLLFVTLFAWKASAASEAGSVSGKVGNAATQSFLYGASVEIPTLGLRTLTDNAGNYMFSNVPSGEHVVTAFYTGLDSQSITVRVESSKEASLNFDLTSAVYQMESFTVVGDREGNAASITRQRNAPNVKNVVAMDAFGTLPNEAIGEVLIRLPGVIGEFAESDSITGVSIRGTPSALNTVSVDGNLQASVGGFGRDYRLDYVSGALYEELEVTKAPTPDMSADGLGGAVNLKTRSTLSMKDRSRMTYRAAARWAPSFYDHTPTRRDHPVHPLFSFGYQRLFDVGGGERNLGVSFNAFYSENVSATDQIIQDYQFTTESPAYVWDYRIADIYVNRVQASANMKLDYKLSDNVQAFVNVFGNMSPSPYNNQRRFRAFTSRSVAALGPDGAPTGTGAIMPGYTDELTSVRPVAASTVELNATSFGFDARQVGLNVGAKHEYRHLAADYDAAYSSSKSDLRNSRHDDNRGGVFTMSTTGIGWELDGTEFRADPVFTQTGGPSIFDGASYRNGLLTARDSERNTEIRSASANLRYLLPVAVPATVKTGVRYRRQDVEEIVSGDTRWSYIGAEPLSVLAESGLDTTLGSRLGNELPFPNPNEVSAHIKANPGSWREDIYYQEMRKFAGTRSVAEEVSAAYLQAQFRVRNLSLLGGARVESTKVESDGYIVSRVQTTAAQRAADPIGSARSDYDNPRHIQGSYTDVFPGLHATYHFKKNLIGRASWSNSIGRPGMTNFLPLETVSTTNETVTVNNPGIKPQYAEKWDLSLEAYFEPVGVLSVGWFYKDIRDYIVTARGAAGVIGTGPDNGYNGDYAGYTLLTQFNGGAVVVDGWEINYSQQLKFVPGLGIFANYTVLRASGDYGDGIKRSTREVANFVPRSLNGGLTYKAGRFGARATVNHLGDTLRVFSTDPSQRVYQSPRTLVNLGFSYRVKKSLEFSCDLTNIFNAPQERYKFSEYRTQTTTYNGTTITFSVSGSF